VRFLADGAGGLPRVAYAIPRRIAGAVGRNRIRRRLRAAMDGLAPELASGAYLISPDAACREVPFDVLVDRLRASLRAAGAIGKDER
jgi:ribonuclease P protein component